MLRTYPPQTALVVVLVLVLEAQSLALRNYSGVLPVTARQGVGVKALAFARQKTKAKAFTPTPPGATSEQLLPYKHFEDDEDDNEDEAAMTAPNRP